MFKPVYKAINKCDVATSGRESKCFFSSLAEKFPAYFDKPKLPTSLIHTGLFKKNVVQNLS